MKPVPSFVVNTGDLTELGLPEEFTAYSDVIKGSPVPIYNAPGNHDVRWVSTGKEAFAKSIGKLYQSFDKNGCHFVILDSTVLLEHWGHFDGSELKWLEDDLRKVKRGTPIMLFFHHPVGRNSISVDNEDELFRIISPYNVVAMFIGHGHSDIEWKINGIQCVMSRGLYQGSYHIVDVDSKNIVIRRWRKGDEAKEPAVIATIPFAAKPWCRIADKWDDPNVSLLQRRRILAELRVGGKGAHDEKVKAQVAIDDGPHQAMERDARDTENASFVFEFPTKGMSPGTHRIRLFITSSDGIEYRKDETFTVEIDENQPKNVWSFTTADTIQSSAIILDNRLYATSFDGKVYCIDTGTGKQKWATKTSGGIFGTPLVVSGTVYVGSMDHFVYALDARTGSVKWRYDTGAPLFATAAYGNGVVCIGGNRNIYGLNAATGKEIWKQPAGSFFQSKAAFVNDKFILGGWDNTLYALNSVDGKPKWAKKMGRTQGGRGSISFYYSPAITSPCIGGERAYVCTNDGVLHAVNINTGDDNWIARAPQGGDTFGYSSPCFANGKVYLGGLGESKRGDCYALDANTGTLVWRCSTGADNYDSSPALVGDTVVIGSVNGVVSWIDAGTGKLAAQYALEPGFCFATPAYDGKQVYIGSMNGKIYALSR